MIDAATAYNNMILHQKREPISRFSTLAEMIRVTSILGSEQLHVFIRTKDSDKFKKRLRELGYTLHSYYPKSLPSELLLVIDWNTANYIGNTENEIND
jgi:hypothetical protein